MKVQDQGTDECLLERTRNGDEAAFRELYNRHKDTTFRFASLLLGSSEYEEYTCNLEKGIMIGGFVRNEDGKPIPDVRVTIVSV